MPPNVGPAAAKAMPLGRCCCGFVDVAAGFAISVTALPEEFEPKLSVKNDRSVYVAIA